LAQVFGITVRSNQAQAHTQFVAKIADCGMNIHGVLDAPRSAISLTIQSASCPVETLPGCDVNFESRIPEATSKAQATKGHQIGMRRDYFSTRIGAGRTGSAEQH